ncbi:hypothetical protein XAUC_04350 [Xanthomonas citri pv. aurantifolii str. ICPB 10535]|nr:hypothetical protein XAUC_04350 [Xanthomonas citri pv. aurantifolii str. ICPB 10535]
MEQGAGRLKVRPLALLFIAVFDDQVVRRRGHGQRQAKTLADDQEGNRHDDALALARGEVVRQQAVIDVLAERVGVVVAERPMVVPWTRLVQCRNEQVHLDLVRCTCREPGTRFGRPLIDFAQRGLGVDGRINHPVDCDLGTGQVDRAFRLLQQKA